MAMEKALIIHQSLPANAPPDELDVLVQADAIEQSLRELGFSNVTKVPVTLNLQRLFSTLKKEKPDLVVNLVETLGGQGRLIHLVAALLDFSGIPYTGTGHNGLYITTDKIQAKEAMTHACAPTPPLFRQEDAGKLPPGRKYILKPVWEDGSVGITDQNVVTRETAKITLEKMRKTGIGEWFFEEYIEGREFNVTLLETADGWRVFRPAEILYNDYPEGKPRILGYESKWHEDSFEYIHTARTFEFTEQDNNLLSRLAAVSLQCVSVFRLGGYARIDLRVDSQQRPYILEANANPCLSPDAGFFAACNREGMSYTTMVRHIVEAAFRNNPQT
jgi:D-alanine-D-alanine ligase